jgi:hypothetical protein
MARLSDSITYGNHAITGDMNVGGTLTIAGVVFQQLTFTGGSNVTVSGTYPDYTISSTTYQAGTGISLLGTTFNVDNPFTPAGTYPALRAQATTKDDVGLSVVDNYSRADYDARYLAIGAKAADAATLDGIDSLGFATSAQGDKADGALQANELPFTFDVSDNITMSGDLLVGGTLTETSSIRYKSNIKNVTGSLDIVSKLQGVTYDKNNRRESGLIAEEVFNVIPSIVTLDANGNVEGINYTRTIAYLIEAIKELKDELRGNK